MAKEPHNTEGDEEGASEESNSAFLFADAAIRGDTHRLARLLVEDLEERDNWFRNELGAMLTHQLGAPVESELFGQEGAAVRSHVESVAGGSRLTFRDVLFTQATSVAWLVRVKEYAKARLERKDPCFPAELARVLYYGSVLAARQRFGEEITSLTDAEFRIGVEWVIQQDWIEDEVRDWFRSARGNQGE
jgi:hypothetical protein